MPTAADAAVRTPFNFHAQLVPGRICQLTKDGKITLTDLMIMWVIDSLIKHFGDADCPREARYCFMSNKAIGEAVGVHEMHVVKRLKVMEGMGLLLRVTVDGQRYLELEWSRTAEERASLKGKYGEEIRKAHRELVNKLEGKPEGLGGVSLEAYPGVSLNAYQTDKKEVTEKNTKAAGTTRPAGSWCRQCVPSVMSPASKDCQCMEWANQLKKAIRKNGHRPKSNPIADWATSFRRLRDREKRTNIQEVLDWYCNNCSQESVDRFNIPVTRDGKHFANAFDWIAREMNKDTKKAREAEEKAREEDPWRYLTENQRRLYHQGHPDYKNPKYA